MNITAAFRYDIYCLCFYFYDCLITDGKSQTYRIAIIPFYNDNIVMRHGVTQYAYLNDNGPNNHVNGRPVKLLLLRFVRDRIL